MSISMDNEHASTLEDLGVCSFVLQFILCTVWILCQIRLSLPHNSIVMVKCKFVKCIKINVMETTMAH